MQPVPAQGDPLPDNVVYTLPSIVQRLDLDDLFPTARPLEIELGSGDGSFLCRMPGNIPVATFSASNGCWDASANLIEKAADWA